MNRQFCLALLSLWALSACATNPVTHKADFVLMSEREEIELGRQYHQQMLAQYRVYRDPSIQAYVNGLGQRMAVLSGRSNLDYRFTVIDSPEINAFALPGGYIYVTRGILSYLNSEAELAGVMGHEIGHVAARHAVRLQAAEKTQRFFGELLFDHLGLGIDQAYSRFTTTLSQGYGREHELEADKLAVEYLGRVGFPPETMSDVIDLLKGRAILIRLASPNPTPDAGIYHGLAQHPDNEQRAQVIRETASRLATEIAVSSEDDQQTYLQRLRGMVFGPSEDQGRVVGGKYLHRPSRTGLRIPPGWTVNNTGQVVQIASPDRDAVIQILRESRPRGTAPRTLLESLPISSPLSDESPLIDGRLRGWVASATGTSPFGERPLRLAAWLSEDQAWIVIGSSRTPGMHAEIIDACILSLHRINEIEMALAEPWRVYLVQAEFGTTYAKLAAESPLGDMAEAQLRLINAQINPREEPVPGDWIKIVR